MRKLDAFQKLALLTTLATYLLILVGGLVRASGAGLGCPDWPKCFGLWIPPTRAEQLPEGWDPALFNATHTWTEYLNRLLGASVGLLILATLVLAVVKHRKRLRVLLPTLGAFIGVLYAAWLGKLVVSSGLEPWMITAHLIVAVVVVSLLLFATAQAFLPDGVRAGGKLLGVLGGGILLIAGTLVQAAIGTQVRAAVQTQMKLLPGQRGAWLEAAGTIDLVHRQVAVAVLALSLVLMWIVRRQARGSWLERVTLTAVLLCFAQIAAGVGLAYGEIPPWLQVAHLSLGSLLLGAQTLVCILAAYGAGYSALDEV